MLGQLRLRASVDLIDIDDEKNKMISVPGGPISVGGTGAGVAVGGGVAVGTTDSRGEQNWLAREQAESISSLARSNLSSCR